MIFKGIAWLENRIPEFNKLLPNEKAEVVDFCLLWSFFESTKLNTDAKISSIKQYVMGLEQQGLLATLDFSKCEIHFQNRYFNNRAYTHHYNDLHLHRSGPSPEVEELLINKTADQKTKLIGCLIIVFRYRNNLFHGEKWQYNLQGQFDNFSHANKLLIDLMS